MVALIDRLEDQDFVVREKDPHDRRAYRVNLTRRGRQAFAMGCAAVDNVDRSIVAAGWDRGDLRSATKLSAGHKGGARRGGKRGHRSEVHL
jgi:DNA-binding MarR family transcriptional regulator